MDGHPTIPRNYGPTLVKGMKDAMANCMICNVEFDPAAGTRKNFCPVHCAPIPGKPAAGSPSTSTLRPIIFLGMIPAIILVEPLLLFSGHWGWFLAVLFVGAFVIAIGMPTDALKASSAGTGAMICPHCQTRGSVRTTHVRRKAGISGGKATAALLTGGVSLLATGLSRKEAVTQAHCAHCGARWVF